MTVKICSNLISSLPNNSMRNCNFTAQRQVFELPPHLHTEKSVWRMGNYAPVGLRPTIGLKPYEALVYQLFG
ncbi:MAG: hypothetical protein EAZ50_07420 [Runella slithyformis]|nr:MAG: hypothetical protein EAZ63_08455 [Runella slithyformis]TAF81064.1 MAG: hypothetical protein EAZ50_07420 [Runella slithyformis]